MEWSQDRFLVQSGHVSTHTRHVLVLGHVSNGPFLVHTKHVFDRAWDLFLLILQKLLLRGGVTKKKTRKFGTMSQLGLTPPSPPTFGTFLKNVDPPLWPNWDIAKLSSSRPVLVKLNWDCLNIIVAPPTHPPTPPGQVYSSHFYTT